MAERNLAIRLTVLDGGKVKAELREVGEAGEKSLKKIELAGQPASKSLLALNAAANDVKGSVVGLTGNLGPLGSALGAIGPVGLAVGAALAVVTLGLKAAFGLRTIRQIISRWAPPNENNTNAYIRAVATDTGQDADQILDMHRFDHLLPLTKAIIRHENGQQPYTDVELTKGLVLAGVEPEMANLQASRTVKGGQTATAATAGLGVVEAIQQTIDPARDALVGLVPYLEVAKWLLLAVTLVGIGVMLWARIDDHRKGLR